MSTYKDNQSDTVKHATYYNYDLDGNVKTLYQQIAGLGIKRIDYEYDLVSGKVNFVRYQDGKADRYYYSYRYDAENRLTDAWSGIRAVIDTTLGSELLNDYKKQDASYQYYLHGPLARTELGDRYGKVQGMDYAYTLQGWLKGVNGSSLSTDVGADGTAIGGIAGTIPKDAYAYSLGYYANDYKPIGGTGSNAFGMQYSASSGDITGQSLYNGNISNSTLAISQIKSGAPVGYSYHYDQLNRLKATRQHTGITGSSWNKTSIKEAYAENVTYDGNGNILAYNRHGADTTGMPKAMDSLRYNYNRDAYGKLTDNRLRQVNDNVASTNYTADIDDQSDANNYRYDATGNLIHDTQAGVDTINWTVYGKIRNIVKGANTIAYTYSPSGQRVSKTAAGLTTWYVCDAQGNTMAVYDNANSHVNWREQHLYGNNRLGMWRPNINLSNNNAVGVFDTTGVKFFELDNQLGNVLLTITDKRLQVATGSVVGRYGADVANAQDYFPFGMIQPGRQFTTNSTTYRYGFNGKENDNEVKGEGNQQDYGMRVSDPRLGRFLSVDPLTVSYPWYTPYQFAGNKPTTFIDRDGEEEGFEYAFDRQQNGFIMGTTKMTPQQIRNGQVARGMGALMGTAIVATVFTGGSAKPVLQKVVTWAISNPRGTMAATGLAWGAVTDEDMPGWFDDVSRDVRQSIYVGERYFYNASNAKSYEMFLDKYGDKVAEAIWNAGGKGGANKLASALEKSGINLFNKQAHHLIPTELIEKNSVVQQAIKEGFDFNGVINGMALGADQHLGSHPNYTNLIENMIMQAREHNTTSSAKQILEAVAGQAKQLIQKSGGKIDKIKL